MKYTLALLCFEELLIILRHSSFLSEQTPKIIHKNLNFSLFHRIVSTLVSILSTQSNMAAVTVSITSGSD